MKITLYKSTSLVDRINKEKELEVYKTLIGNLRDEANLASPIITIELATVNDKLVKADDIQVIDTNLIEVITIDDIPDLIQCNYLYIEEFKRYYFIKDIIALRTNLWELTCNVDVLMSFKNNFNVISGYLDRGSTELRVSDDILLDPIINSSINKEICVWSSPIGKKFYNTVCDLHKNGNTVCSWVGHAAGAHTKELIERATSPNNGGLNNYPIKFTFFNNGWSSLGILNAASLIQLYNHLNTEVKIDFGYFFHSYDPTEYIQALRWYPFDVNKFLINSVSESNIHVGIHDTGVKCIPMDSSNIQNTIEYAEPIYFYPKGSDHFQFADYPPYSEYTLYAPFFGWIDLPAEELFFKNLYFRLSIDFNTGEGMLIILASEPKETLEDARIILTQSTQLGIDIPISGTNLRENTANFYRSLVNLGIAGATAAASAIPYTSTTQSTTTTSKTTNKTVPYKTNKSMKNPKFGAKKSTSQQDITQTKVGEYKTHPSALSGFPLSSAVNSALSNSTISAKVQRTSGNTPLNNYAITDKLFILAKYPKLTVNTDEDYIKYIHEYGVPICRPVDMSKILSLPNPMDAIFKYSTVNIKSIPGCTDNELVDLEEILLEGFHV